MPTLALSMIVKNGECTLAQCLDSVRGVADEIVIADTGSTDRTLEIARQYGATVFSIPWENDFAKARNRSLAQVRSEWVLMMDADEVLDPEVSKVMPDHLKPESVIGYTVTIRNYTNDRNSHLWDQQAQPNTNPPAFAKGYAAYLEHVNVRLFRRHPDVFYQGAVHETVGYRLFELGAKIGEATFLIHHFGFLDTEGIRAGKSKFYRELGRQKLIELPENALAHYELGLEEWEHFQNYEAALPLFKRTCELNPRFGPGWLFYARTLGRLGRYREALEALDRAKYTSVRREALLEAQGDTHHCLGNFEEACRLYRQVLELAGGKPQIESKLGFTEVRQGRTQMGLDRMRATIECEPENAEFHDRLIAAYAWLGEIGKAAEAAEEKLDRVEPQAESFLRAASLRAQLQAWPQAEELARRGLEQFPEDGKLRNALAEAAAAPAAQLSSQGDARFQAQDFESACRCYQEAIDCFGYRPDLESKLGLAQVRAGHIQDGLMHLERAIEHEPASPAPYDRLIAARVWLGQLEDAARTAESKLVHTEPQPVSFLRAATLHARLRNWLHAASVLQQGLALFPENDELLRAAGEIRDSGFGIRVSALGAGDS
jgi:tetratricopeptide (TPR) repeat protein